MIKSLPSSLLIVERSIYLTCDTVKTVSSKLTIKYCLCIVENWIKQKKERSPVIRIIMTKELCGLYNLKERAKYLGSFLPDACSMSTSFTRDTHRLKKGTTVKTGTNYTFY